MDLRIDFDSAVLGDHFLWDLDPLMNRDTLLDNGIVLHTVMCQLCIYGFFLAWSTHLLMLNILSIFVIPSQCRISGIRAWKCQ